MRRGHATTRRSGHAGAAQQCLVASSFVPCLNTCCACRALRAVPCPAVEGELLQDQVEDVKKASEYVSQLRRVGKGLGVYQFDRNLQ